MADISVVKLPNNSSYNLKDANAIHGDGRSELKYINSHPENNPTILPFINNDIAFFSVRGGTYSVYTTTSTDYTPLTLNGVVTKDINLENAFDGSPTYSSLKPAITNLSDKIVIDLTLFRKFSESNVFYMDFGNAWWAPKSITYLTLNPQSNTYELFKEVSLSSSIGSFMSRNGWRSYNADNTVYDYGRTKIRIVVTNFNSKDTRIAQIGLLQYNSPGIRETYMSRGIDDPIYRSITPNTNNTYDLGSSSKKWANGYFEVVSGRILTSFKNSVAMGSFQASSNTIPDLCEELRYSSGCAGSANITTTYTLSGNSTIYAGWYNFLWIPHRSGGINGAASGDNCDFGSLLLSTMDINRDCYLLKYINSAIRKVVNLTKDTTYSVATTSSNGLMSSSDKTKLNGISSSYDSATETLTITL